MPNEGGGWKNPVPVKKIEEVEEKNPWETLGELQNVENKEQKPEEGIEKPKTKNVEEVDNYIKKLREQKETINNLYKEKIKSIYEKIVSPADIKTVDLSYGFTLRPDWKNLEEAKRQEIRTQICVEGADVSDIDHHDNDLRMLRHVSIFTPEMDEELKNIGREYREIKIVESEYETVRDMITSVNATGPDRKEEILRMLSGRNPESKVIYDSLLD